MHDLLGAVGFGLLGVLIYAARPRVKPPTVPRPLKVELQQVGPPARSTRFRFPTAEYERIPLTKSERFFILSRDNFTCQYCGRKSPDVVLEVDHKIPVTKGGSNHPTNLVTSCYDCNRGKGVELVS